MHAGNLSEFPACRRFLNQHELATASLKWLRELTSGLGIKLVLDMSLISDGTISRNRAQSYGGEATGPGPSQRMGAHQPRPGRVSSWALCFHLLDEHLESIMTDAGSKMNVLLRLEKSMSTNGALCDTDLQRGSQWVKKTLKL